jgi:D-alanyl-lipoteichoic acid acyltransferase DltB (MBOAT superfamily)
LFFDFSGYTDIAIGLGILLGIRLPENFDRPYTRQNITTFWQSWHITLSNWVRFYVFSPLSRGLLRQPHRLPTNSILLISHLTTMIIIGLWHGITWTFFIWGLWHGLGLFIHKLWSDRTRKSYRGLQQRPVALRLWQITGILLTFHFVLLGWVWFALPDVDTAITVFLRLFGAA